MKRKFNFEDQIAFAALSGDYNPIHVDALAARRLLFGAPLVHGVHSVMWALDSCLQNSTEALELHSLRTTFFKPVRVGEEIDLAVQRENGHIKIDLRSGEFI